MASGVRNERFDKLVEYIHERARPRFHKQQHFSIPQNVLLSAYNTKQFRGRRSSEWDYSKSIGQNLREGVSAKASLLEVLPHEILFSVLHQLSGNDLIMLSLTSKTLALAIARGDFEMYNNTHFTLRRMYLSRTKGPCHCPISPDNPSRDLYKRSCDGRWECPRNCCDLLNKVEQWLGNDYAFCQLCYKFRSRKENWWTAFAEYVNPGVSNSLIHAKKVDRAIKHWLEGDFYAYELEQGGRGTVFQCPAHLLLQETEKRSTVEILSQMFRR